MTATAWLGRTLAMGALWAVAWAWSLLAGTGGCVLAAAVLAVLTAALALAGIEAAGQRRLVFVAQYLAPQGRLARLLGGWALLSVWQVLRAVVPALLLLVALIGSPRLAGLLVLDVPLLAALVAGFEGALRREVREVHRDVLARRWAAGVNALALWLLALAWLLGAPQERWAGWAWQEVVRHAVAGVAADCPAVAVLARAGAAAEALALWGAQSLIPRLEQPGQIAMAWVAFLGAFGASLVLAWLWSRALTGVLARPWRLWRSAR